jgi:hypothetical protein
LRYDGAAIGFVGGEYIGEYSTIAQTL